jgi:hypothetical protein
MQELEKEKQILEEKEKERKLKEALISEQQKDLEEYRK